MQKFQVKTNEKGRELSNRAAYHIVCTMAAAGSKLKEHMPDVSEETFATSMYAVKGKLLEDEFNWETFLMNLNDFFKIAKVAMSLG